MSQRHIRMVPTVQPPPPPVESSNSASDTKVSLDDMVYKLHDLIFAIALPKTKTAKTAVINIEVLHLARNLAESACALLQEHWKGPQLDDISRQLEVIKAHLDIPSAAQSPQKLSYAATVAIGTQSPSPGVSPAPPPHPLPARRFDITVTQKSRNEPVFANLSNKELIARILAALRAADVWLDDRPRTPDSEGIEGVDRLTPCIRAVGCHWSGDIWIATTTEAGRNALAETIDDWLPLCSDRLQYTCKTYPVLVHSVPTTLDTLRSGKDINDHLIEYNTDIITHPSALQSAKFLGNTHSRTRQKSHGSLVLYFTYPATANACINHHIALDGGLLPTVKFMRRPPRCFNCHHTGHFAHSCKAQRSCGLCTGDHDTRHCRSSRRDGPAGHFALLKCALCCVPHAASDDSFPARKAAINKYWTEVTSTGPYYLLPK